jgi:serine/threonine protein kinase
MPHSVGDKLGPYEILAPTGAGGMGALYKARDTRLDRIVAIKVFKTHTTLDLDTPVTFGRIPNTPLEGAS